MQIRIFEADDMRSALEKVKQALGPGALIVSTRNIVRKNRFGLPGKTVIEVTAAIDNDTAPGEPLPPPRPAKQGAVNRYAGCASFDEVLEKGMPGEKRTPGASAAKSPDRDLAGEIRRMRESFSHLSREFSQAREAWAKQWFATSAGTGAHAPGLDKGAGEFLSRLHDRGLDATVIGRFFETMSDGIGAMPPGDEDAALSLLGAFIAANFSVNHPLARGENGKRRIAFIGPTGVGKTTTIAKVAAHYMITQGRDVALATIDNYRIAAAEQLKIYGEIMNIPVEVARTPEQLARIVERHSEKGLLLVDTAGKSPRDEMSRNALGTFLDPSLGLENHLVLSAATRESELLSTIRHFDRLGLHGIVFTKTDECDILGQILNIGIQAGYPLSMLTNGQRVPEDFLLPEPGVLAEMILTKNKADEQWNMEKEMTRPERSVH